MAIVIDGNKIAKEILGEVAAAAASLGRKPKLAVVLAGEDAASKVYVNKKHKTCAEVGFESVAHELSADVSQEEVLALVEKLCRDGSVDGILVQHPMPPQIDEAKVFAAIAPDKDVDGFNPINAGKLALGEEGFVPCTPLGIMELLKRYNIEVKGKSAVVIGRSNIVGKPMARLLLAADATVTVCHSKTVNVTAFTSKADILIAAVGKKAFVTADMVKYGAAVIDVGIHRGGIHRNGSKLCGDVEFDGVSDVAKYITPVPGGVGPMTIAMLMKNCLKAAARHG